MVWGAVGLEEINLFCQFYNSVKSLFLYALVVHDILIHFYSLDVMDVINNGCNDMFGVK